MQHGTGGKLQQFAGGGIGQLQFCALVKRKDRKLHAFDDTFQQGEGLGFAMTADAQIAGELVDLGCKIAKRIALADFASAKGIFIFAQCGDDVGQGLQGSNDVLKDCRTQPRQRKKENHKDTPPDQAGCVPQVQHDRGEQECGDGKRDQ
jgi:hypothetical protein